MGFKHKKGFSVISSNEIKQKSQDATRLSFTEATVGEHLINLSYENTIRLHESDKSFTFEFADLSFDSYGKSYFYRLLPIDAYWSEVKSTNKHVRYECLSGGKYKLQIKAEDSRGNCLATDEREVIVTPFFYKTLGLPYNIFNMYKKRRGLILIVGPTGSGKSTTLASFLDIINQNLYKHIITLEDPIEYLHWHNRSIINQREIGTDCDSFANGLRAALREDPDVILVGEMRDLETTEIAITAAETGHLVCSTLHTLGAAETVNRIVDMFPQSQQNQIRSQLVGILEAVVSQQLLQRKRATD